jgi:TonB family protein
MPIPAVHLNEPRPSAVKILTADLTSPSASPNMSAMRTVLLLCLSLAVVLAGEKEQAAGRRITKLGGSTLVLPFWTIEVKPWPYSIPDAEYPEAARKAHIEGLAAVEALVGTHGGTEDVRLYKSSGNAELDQAAVAAARKAKFRPAMSRDVPTRKWATIPYRFALESGKGIAPARSISLVTSEAVAPSPEVKRYNDSVLGPLRGLTFVRLKPIATRAGVHGRLTPDSATIRFNNEAMVAACTAYSYGQGDSLRRPGSYYLQSDWYYLVIDSGGSRIYQRNHPHYPSSRAEVYGVDTLLFKPAGLDTHYVEMPGWTALPQYAPLKIEFVNDLWSRMIQAPTFRLEVQ